MISADPNWLIRGWRLLRFRWSRTQLERELAEEIEFHRSLKQAENRRAGLSLDAARALSRRQMGNMTIAREECRDMWSFVKLERLLKDVRYAARILRRSPVRVKGDATVTDRIAARIRGRRRVRQILQ